MTLKFIQGFETCRDDTDFRAQGWIAAPVKKQVFFPTSFTGVGSSSLYCTLSRTATTVPGTASADDIGYFNTGVTVNQAWQAGGFSLGCAIKLNQLPGTQAQAPSSQNVVTPSLAFDGTLYWAINSSGSVMTSPDLVNWSVLPRQPSGPTAMSSTSGIYYLGNGLIVVSPNVRTTTVRCVYTTKDGGQTWQTVNLGTIASTTYYISVVATGNASFPHALACASATAGVAGIWVGDLSTGSMTQAVSIATAMTTNVVSQMKVVNGYIVVWMGASGSTTSGYLYSALANSSSLNTAGAWSSATSTSTFTYIADVGFLNNSWIFVASTGIWVLAGFGNAPPTGTFTPTSINLAGQTFSGTGTLTIVNGVAYATAYRTSVGTTLFSSPDGISWTPMQRLTGGGNSTGITTVVYDGSKYVMVASGGNIFQSTDMNNNWRSVYCPDLGDNTQALATLGDIGIWTGTAPSQTTGQWTANGATYSASVKVSSASSSARTIALFYNGTTLTNSTVTLNVPANNLYRYVEIVARPTTTVNQFNLSLYVDQQLVGTAVGSLAQTSDTTSLMIIVLATCRQVTQFDDMYFTIDDGQGITGPLGICNVAAIRPSTDVQAQWSKTGTASSNAGSVRQGALSSNSVNSVTTYTSGNKDIYATTDTIPAGFDTIAVQFEGYTSKAGTFNSSTRLGIISGSVEVDTNTIVSTTTTPTYVNKVVQNDPNGNVKWTPTSVQGIKFTVSKL